MAAPMIAWQFGELGRAAGITFTERELMPPGMWAGLNGSEVVWVATIGQPFDLVEPITTVVVNPADAERIRAALRALP